MKRNITICTLGDKTYLTAEVSTVEDGVEKVKVLWRQELPGRLLPEEVQWPTK